MDELDDFQCKIKVRPVEEWFNDEQAAKEGCPPCLIAPLSGYYLGTLEAAGETAVAAALKQSFADGDILTIVRKLDSIKTDVGEALSKQLRNLDCFAQSFKQDDASN